MNRLQKATTALVVLFAISLLDGLLDIGLSDNIYVVIGFFDIVALYFVWRAAFPKK